MKFIENLSFRNKLCLLLLVPIVGILFFSFSGIIEKYQFTTAMDKIESLTKMSTKVSALLHETQKERGTTAVYMSSQGRKFAKRIGQQHKQTDLRLEQLQSFFAGRDDNSFALNEYGKKFQQAVTKIQLSLDKIPNKRNQAKSFELETQQIIIFYSQLNRDLLALLDEIPSLSSDAKIAMMSNSYVSFLRAKELAGIERAVISSILSVNNNAARQQLGDNIEKSIALIAKQQAFFVNFRVSASKASIQALQTLDSSASANVVNKIRVAIFDGFLNAGVSHFNIKVDTWFDAISEKINGLKKIENEISIELLQLAKSANQAATTALLFYSAIVIFMVILTLVLSVMVIRIVLGQLGGEPVHVSSFAQKIAAGDLSSQEQKSAQSGLGACVLQISSKLREVVLSVKQGSDDSLENAEYLSLETEQMSAVIDSQSSRSSQVASAITQMSQTIAEVASNTAAIAQSAVGATESTAEAKNIVTKSKQEAQKVCDIVTDTEESIKVLGNKITEVSKVVDVINKIADQTNLLALNAAIEAARAGEHGRGFAVVADEVRSLAVHTVNSTQEIEQMINDVQQFADQAVNSIHQSQSMVLSGVEFANDTAQTIDSVVTEMNSLQGMVEQVASATEELSVVSDNIMTDVIAISEHSQTISTSFESVSSTAMKLKGHSSQLVGSVSYFSL